MEGEDFVAELGRVRLWDGKVLYLCLWSMIYSWWQGVSQDLKSGGLF